MTKSRMRIRPLYFCLLFFALLVSGCTRTEAYKNRQFDELMDELFLSMLSDPLNVNFFIRNPEAFGLDDLEVLPVEMSEEAHNEYIEYLETVKTALLSYQSGLSKDRQLTYDVVTSYLDYQLAFADFYYFERPLGSYIGYQAELPIILSEYHFYRKEDLDNYLLYLQTANSSFTNIAVYEREKADHGYGMPDPVLNGIIKQIDGFVGMEENYLISSFDKKIEALDFLTEQEKSNYRMLNRKYIEENLIPAYRSLRSEMVSLLGKAQNQQGLMHFSGGRKYYEALFKQATGTQMSPSSGYLYLSNLLDQELSELIDILQDNPSYAEEIYGNLFPAMDYNQVLEFYMEHYAADFLSIADVTVRIESIPLALEEFSSPAMYFVSPLDADVTEVIYINDTIFSEDPTYAAITLSHEGIPGHLLQHVALKKSNLPNIRKMLDFNSYSEGWATYVEQYSTKYYDIDSDLMKAYHLNESITYLLYGISDIGIHYYGWSMNDLQDFLSVYISIGEEKLSEMYYQIIEVPTNSLEYYFSYYQILDLKEEFLEQSKSKQLENPDYEFHKFYLEIGPAPFPIMEDYIDDYLLGSLQS